MNHQNISKLIFEECEECGKELNEMEKEYCKKMTEKTFEEVKARIKQYLENSRTEDPHNIVNEYFGQISVERRISEAEELLDLIREAIMTKPNTPEDRCRSGSPGVIVLDRNHIPTIINYCPPKNYECSQRN